MVRGDEGKGKSKAREYAAPIADPRFAKLHSDPRFLRPNREEGKVVLDDRFKGILKDDKSAFKGQRRPKLDKFGRPVRQDQDQQADLKRIYRAEENEQEGSDEEDSSSEEEDAKPERAVDYARGEGQLDSSGDEDESDEEEESDDDDDEDEVVIGSAAARRRDLYRHGSDESDVEDVEEGEENEAQLAKLDAEAEKTIKREAKAAKAKPVFAGDTARLAVVNMDWDHIRAIDLFKVFSSVVSPAGASGAGPSSKRHGERQIVPIQGRCLSVYVYPSEFGRKRMAKETMEGPPREIFASEEGEGSSSSKRKNKKKKSRSKGDDSSDEEIFQVDEGGDFDEEALRKYQLDRLRYHYAIATFDRPETARFIMDEIDGTEMEHSANMFDLSFVPKEMTFPDWEAPKDDPGNEGYRDFATETSDEAGYSGVKFMTDALRHSKVTLTWDADDPQRSKVTRQAAEKSLNANQIRDEDFKAYLASASEDSEPEKEEEEGADKGGEEERERMRALLGLNGNSSGGNAGFGKAKSTAFADARKQKLQEGQGDMQITFMPGLSEAAERKKKGIKADEEETTLDAYKRKQREKRERRRNKDGEEVGEDAEQEKGEYGFDDPFFADDGEVDFDAALAEERSGKQGKKQQQQNKKTVGLKDPESASEDDADQLQLMIDSEDEGESGAGHFSLKDILKAEQAADGKAKKNRWAKKKEKKLAKQGGEVLTKGNNEVQPGFDIDVQDSRFAGLYGDHRFALDPNHPSFVKTKNMQKLVDERRKQDKKRQRKSEKSSENAGKENGDSKSASNGEKKDDISHLVQSFKKRAAEQPVNHSGKNKKSKNRV
ncbi:uncharacterized protein FA14DRAFT_13033 [Meira miltonrushii]|uniref:Uncharacterized protein n=1 Tax=Meira miltonrushii TaxID=1280837 RepID=A0A316VMI6_9BASI|nr:uncharacterized protein FA14DRAFT_13033 [Meira miltonrushii]PWN37311.1 hypothetical protein FA14DRAFT_13033 [Meira miltonrushii]